MQYDLLIKNGYLVDYATAQEGFYDVAICDGVIVAVENNIDEDAGRVINAGGRLVLPGLVDSHVHASAWLGGGFAHAMLVKAGADGQS